MGLFKISANPNGDNGDYTPDNVPVTADNVEFIPNVPIPNPNTNLGMSKSEFVDTVRQGIDVTRKAVDIANKLREGDITGAARSLGQEEAADLIGQVTDIATGVSQTIKVIKSADDGYSPPTGGGSPGNNTGNSYYNTTRLSIDLAPTEVRFETGIKPDTFSPDYQISEEGYASPCFMSLCNFSIPTDNTASLAGNFFSSAVMFDLRNTIQRNITFSPDPTLVAPTNLTNALNQLCYALSIYYAATRFFVYGNDPMNKNEALLYMRGTLTANLGDSYLSLRRMLEGIPIPPNLNTIIFYLYQIYLSSELPGSPVIMISPNRFTNGVPDWTELASAITGLTTYTSTYSLIGRAIPAWYSTKLLTGISNPLHDPNFSTIWTNLPFQQRGSSPVTYNILGPSVSGNDINLKYNSYTNNLDGAAFALLSTWNTTSSVWTPSMMQPVNDNVTTATNFGNRLSWHTVSGVTKFYDSYLYDTLSFTRDETYTTSYRFVNAVSITLPFGAERCWGVTTRTVTNCTYQLLDWIMTWSTVTSRSDRSLAEQGPLDMTRGKRHPGGSKSGGNMGQKKPRKSNKKKKE